MEVEVEAEAEVNRWTGVQVLEESLACVAHQGQLPSAEAKSSQIAPGTRERQRKMNSRGASASGPGQYSFRWQTNTQQQQWPQQQQHTGRKKCNSLMTNYVEKRQLLLL